MSLDMFKACIDGYADRLLDQQILALQTGHWAAYYVGSKHPKSAVKIAAEMQKHHKAADKRTKPKPDVDVERFMQQEARFRARVRKHKEVKPPGSEHEL